MKKHLAVLAALVTAAGVMLGMTYPAWAQKEIVIGLQCDRTGATQTVGVNLCPGYHDYIALVNSKGGVEGYKIRALEIDTRVQGAAGRWRPTSATRRRAPC